MLHNIIFWLSSHYIEIVGTILSILYVFLSIKQNIWLWPTGIISSLFYCYIFFDSKIYADMSLQVYYVVVSIYGWYFWIKKTNVNNETKLNPQKISYNMAIILLLTTGILFLIISQILINFTDSVIPYLDAFTTSASFIATWMLVKKYIEHWFIWIVVDTLSIGIYFYKELYFTVFLYIVYSLMAIVGYIEWKKSLKNELLPQKSKLN